METPNKQSAQRTSNTLKSHLQDEAYLRALEMFENAQHKIAKIIDL